MKLRGQVKAYSLDEGEVRYSGTPDNLCRNDGVLQ